jgi:N-methylhydantoinase A
MALRLATDIGGTFTDLVAYDEATGQLLLGKASSTPRAFAQGILDAIESSATPLEAVSYVVHGCTVVINAITERKGAKTALITTEGFRDVLEIGRGNRPDMYNLRFQKPAPFVPRRLRFEVPERVSFRGEVLRPLDLSGLPAIVERLRAEHVEAVAICLLHAYAYPAHERELAAALRALLPGLAVTASSDISQEWREYERSSTAVLNAYVMPTLDRYLGELELALHERGVAAPLQVMQSNGGTASFASARRLPIYLLESGPVAGVIGAAAVGAAIGETNLISLDIGGTTAKCSLIEHNTPKITSDYRLEWSPLSPGYPVKTAVVDIVEIGTGGGSIAYFDEGDTLRVGPRSAGADPGPACYGRGGELPTVTDAKLVAGVINPANVLGGRLKIYPELARRALEPIARRLGTSVEQAANGIIRMADAHMTEALKLVSVRRGYDPRDFALVAMGGGGAMHAAALAQELQLKQVIVPRHPGLFSAWGMLTTQPRVDAVRTRVYRTSEVGAAQLAERFAELEHEVLARFRQDGSEVGVGELLFQRSVDMRYHGQEHTVAVALGEQLDVGQIEASFHANHERLYTFRLADTPIEFVNFHVAGRQLVPTPAIAPLDQTGLPLSAEPVARRRVDFDLDGLHEAAIYQRELLPVGFCARGPLIVEEESATTLVHPGQELSVDAFGNLVIRLRAEGA